MELKTPNFTRLEYFEQRFRAKFQDLSPQILADVLVSPREVEELGELVGDLLRWGMRKKLQAAYPLCVSLFLVWCTVYHYKEGKLWEPIFAKLNVQDDNSRRKFLGDLFLATLSDYRLQLAPDDGSKRYMTPILMHGYISDYYADRLLDYLNAIYTSYLEYNVTDNALDGLWSDLFNLDEEQTRISDAINQLIAEEQRLQREIEGLQIPGHISEHMPQTIEALKAEIDELVDSRIHLQERLERVSGERLTMEALLEEFRRCEAALAALDEVQAPVTEPEISELSAQVVSAFNEQLTHLRCVEKELLRELTSMQNRQAIAKDRRAKLMAEIVRLGNGSIDRGYLILDEYRKLKTALDQVSRQRKQRESLLSFDQELGSTSVEQILTASLATLGRVNPSLFQEFIKTAIRMLDQICKEQEIRQDHRMSEPIQKWFSTREKRAAARRMQEQSATGAARVQRSGETAGSREAVRVSSVRLTRPSLLFSGEQRQVVLAFPQQELRMPGQIKPQVSCAVDYGKREEPIEVVWQVKRNKLYLGSLEVPVLSGDLRGLRFQWFNLFEYWPLALEEVMVFAENGRLESGKQLKNGFYYILARSSWRTDCDFVIDSYPCNMPGYVVYEVQLKENSMVFYSDGREVAVSASRYFGISLQNVTLIPGVVQDGLPVAKGSPRLEISKYLVERSIPGTVLELRHNGAILHNQDFRRTVEEFGEEHTSRKFVLDLERFAPLSRGRPCWETFEIEVRDEQGEAVFQDSLCIVRGLSVSYETDSIKVEVPRKSNLQHPAAKREGKTYLIPVDDAQKVSLRIFFPRIGWKDFEIDVPGGRVDLLSSDGHPVAMPLAILASERRILETLTVRFQANSNLVNTVRVSDSTGTLVLNHSLSCGRAEIPLVHFVDNLTDVQAESEIVLEWEGVLGSRGIVPLATVYSRIDVREVEIYISEQEEEHLLELSFTADFPDLQRLRFRLRPEGSEEVLFERSLRGNPDHFYLRKHELTSLSLQAEIYYSEKIESVFGTETTEHVCWSGSVQLSNRQALVQKVISQGVMLKSFRYNGTRFSFSKPYAIKDICLFEEHFEGEEMLKGKIQLENGFQEVRFYLDTESITIPFLVDEELDGVQYDPKDGRIFWELSSGNVMSPLDDLEFVFLGEDE
jgi:hypothetical protein